MRTTNPTDSKKNHANSPKALACQSKEDLKRSVSIRNKPGTAHVGAAPKV